MATRIMRVCDVCAKPVEGDPIRFGWGTAFYETDLCEKHGEEFRVLMEKTLRTARRLGAPATTVTPKVRRDKRPNVSTKEVRDWAQEQGIEVNERGRVPESLIVQFLAAKE
jgi:sugar phosphate isomerase/epimerase